MTDPMHHSNDIKQSEMDPQLFAAVSHMIRNAEYNKGLLALNEELQQHDITPGELAAILYNYRQASIYAEDLGALAYKITHTDEEYGVIGFKVVNGEARKLAEIPLHEQDLPSRRKHSRRNR